MQHPHPWRRFRALVDWTLLWVDLPDGMLGFTHHPTKTVVLALGMNQAERRCTIAHETEHILAGPPAPGLEGRDELRARRNAAQALLPDIRAIGDAMAWSQGCLHQAADELWVDVDTLRDRLRFLSHPAERAYLRRRLADVIDHPAVDGLEA